MNNYFIDVPCPSCKGRNYTITLRSTYPVDIELTELLQTYSSSSDTMLMDQLVKCNKCELIYINPQLKPDLILGGYVDAIDPTFILQNTLRIKTFTRSLNWVCKKLNITPNKQIKVLDVGCAGGAFPVAADLAGFSIVGIEPSKWLSKKAREEYKLDIRTGSLEEQNFAKKSFNIVTLWDVIEHLTNPSGAINSIAEILEDDGMLLINYPNYDSLIRKLMGKKWPFFLSVHLIYFTPKTIKNFLHSCGFEIIAEKPYWQTLELGYALDRAGSYFHLFKLLSFISKFVKIDRIPLKYQMGQTLIIAKKNNDY